MAQRRQRAVPRRPRGHPKLVRLLASYAPALDKALCLCLLATKCPRASCTSRVFLPTWAWAAMLRKRGESAWRLAPALWAVFLLLSATAAAQEVPLVAAQAPSSCSAGVPPSPPTGLRTKPAGDGSVRLEWAAPANRACVKEYQVSVFPLGGPRAAATPIQKTPVSAFNLTVVGLENNIEHRFFVRAVGSDATGWPMPGGEAQVTATPTAACSAGLLPTAPTNLTAQPLAAGGGIRLCWGPPDNSACVDEYRVAVTPQASGLKVWRPLAVQFWQRGLPPRQPSRPCLRAPSLPAAGRPARLPPLPPHQQRRLHERDWAGERAAIPALCSG